MAQDVQNLPRPSSSNVLDTARPELTSTEVRMVQHLPEPVFPDTGMVGMINGLCGLPGIDPDARFQAPGAYPGFYYEQHYAEQQWTPSMGDYYDMQRPVYGLGVYHQYDPNDVPFYQPPHLQQQYSVLPPSASGMHGDCLQVISPATPLVEATSDLQMLSPPIQEDFQSKPQQQTCLPVPNDTAAKPNRFRKVQAQKDYEDNGHATGNPTTSTR